MNRANKANNVDSSGCKMNSKIACPFGDVGPLMPKTRVSMSEISTPDLTDDFPDARAIELQFNNYGAVKQFAGPAVTIKCHEDNSLVKACVGEPGEGRVIDLVAEFTGVTLKPGFDPQDHPRLGFNYAVTDRELGQQTLTVGSPMPYQEDPSLWATLELVRR